MVDAPSGELRTAEVIGTLCLATDLAIGLPLEHGLQSTIVAMRLCDRLQVEDDVATQTYFGCLLFWAGCTTDAEISSALFADGALLEHFNPVIFGSPGETVRGIMRALADPGSPAVVRALQGAVRLPGAGRGHKEHIVAMCEVGEMLSDGLGMPAQVRRLVPGLTARWDGKGTPGWRGDELPVALRIVHVARDALFQHLLGGNDRMVGVLARRSGAAFDPAVVDVLLDDPATAVDFGQGSVWEDVLALEPDPWLVLRGGEIDRALGAMGNFADLVSSYFAGHSSAVAELAAAAAQRVGLDLAEIDVVRRAGFVHDLGRVAVSTSVWNKPGALSADEWERVRLHAHHSERVIARSSTLEPIAAVAGAHHERLDGSGYHRGSSGPVLSMPVRVLAAADAYRTLVEPRPHRGGHSSADAARLLGDSVDAGELDADAVAAVLQAAGQVVPRMRRPAGLTDREATVVGLVARGLQTKQVAHRLGISPKTADRHLQNAYAKMGVSTRAAATLFAMEHGLVPWGELPMSQASARS